MRSARFYGIHDIRFEETEKPACGAAEVLIRVQYAGICGSDLHIYNQGMFIQHIPETMGHEFVGIVEETGSAVSGFAEGDCVTANPMVPCMACESCRAGSYNTCENLSFIGECRPGCFAEYLVMPADTLIRIPDGTDLRLAALTEPLAVALNICRRAAFQPGDRVAVMGAGPIGLLTLLAARALYGVTDLTAVDLSEARRALAEQVGAAQAAAALDGTYDKIVDAAGVPATCGAALSHVRANGAVYVVSIFEKLPAIDINDIVAKQIALVGCNVYTRRDLEEAAQAIAEGRIDVGPLISRVYDIADCGTAFQAAASADRTMAKILLRP